MQFYLTSPATLLQRCDEISSWPRPETLSQKPLNGEGVDAAAEARLPWGGTDRPFDVPNPLIDFGPSTVTTRLRVGLA